MSPFAMASLGVPPLMGLNDEAEKLRQAGEWLKGDPKSEQFGAAWAHVTHMANTTADPALSAQARQLEDATFGRFGFRPAYTTYVFPISPTDLRAWGSYHELRIKAASPAEAEAEYRRVMKRGDPENRHPLGP